MKTVKSVRYPVAKMALIITPVLMLVIGFSACKKDKAQNSSSCRIITIVTGPDTTHLYYNSVGKISKLIDTRRDSANYEYTGSDIVITYFQSGTFAHKYVTTVNTAGLVTNIRSESQAGATLGSTRYEYNGEEVTREINTSSTGIRDTTTFTWSDHNLLSDTRGGRTTTYTYYTDKLYREGDYRWLSIKTAYGADIIRTRNLLKSSGTTIYTYQFDADQKISSFTIGSITVGYGYECH
jgi:hypothetical protein